MSSIFLVKQWKTKAIHYIKRSYARDDLVLFPKMTMQQTVSIGCTKFAVKTPHSIAWF